MNGDLVCARNRLPSSWLGSDYSRTSKSRYANTKPYARTIITSQPRDRFANGIWKLGIRWRGAAATEPLSNLVPISGLLLGSMQEFYGIHYTLDFPQEPWAKLNSQSQSELARVQKVTWGVCRIPEKREILLCIRHASGYCY